MIEQGKRMNRTRRDATRAAFALLATVALAAGLSACSPTTFIDELIGRSGVSESERPAQIENRALEQAADELLNHIYDGEWELPAGGNVRRACATAEVPSSKTDGFLFYGSWFSPQAAAFSEKNGDAKASMSELRSWLELQGWSEFSEFELTPEVSKRKAHGVEGSNPDAGIEWAQVTYYFAGDEGRNYPHIVVDIDSECLVSDL